MGFSGSYLPLKVVFVFDHLGPYHLARISAAAKVPEWDVWGIELHPKSRTYAWESSKAAFGFHKISLPNLGLSGSAERFALLPHLEGALASCLPDVVFVNGWGDFMSLETIRWAKKQGVRLVVMSETRRVDGERSWWGEWVKSRIVSICDAGFCGGESHRRYLGELGLPKDRVALGYNAVDNDFFAAAKKSGIEGLRAMWPQEGGTTKGTNLYELGGDQGAKSFGRGGRSFEPRIAQINTDSEPRNSRNDTKSRNWSDAQGTCAGAAFSNPFISELARDSENTALIPSADGSAFLPATSNSLPATAPEALAAPYFLASNRFVERKNLGRLIRAYAGYVERFQQGAVKSIWPLVLLGDGELRGELQALCGELGIKVFSFQGSVFSREKEGDLNLNSYKLKTPAEGGCVVFTGFRQVEELPFFYAGAGAFIHPALSEPWGLVINEAMASGLPVLSSRNVGAAEELVQEGVNGFSFDPDDVEGLAGLMAQMAGMSVEKRLSMGKASERLILEWGSERFSRGAQDAVRVAMSAPTKCAGIFDCILLEILIRK
jgi:glycosyltransferase involved in cell wall biosynthesis